MYQKGSIGLDEALGAINAMLEEIKSHPDKYWQIASIAIVDEGGRLVAFAKMDGLSMMAQDIAIRKARTAAAWRRNTEEVNKLLKTREWDMFDFMPTGSTRIPGGVAIVDPQEPPPKSVEDNSYRESCIGAIGVSAAGPWQKDLEVANVGLKYIQKRLWSQE
jgi:glc operon protein GlcG